MTEAMDIYTEEFDPNADVQIYVVKNISVVAGAIGANSKFYIFIDGGTPISGLAQEIGHALGIPENADDNIDRDNVMSDPQNSGSTKIRRKDWNIVNP